MSTAPCAAVVVADEFAGHQVRQFGAEGLAVAHGGGGAALILADRDIFHFRRDDAGAGIGKLGRRLALDGAAGLAQQVVALALGAGAFLLLGLLPLPLIGLEQLKSSYIQYFDLLKTDHSVFYGLSVMGWLKSWFSLDPSKIMVVGSGFLLMFLPLLRYRSLPEYRVRVLLLAAVLIWVVIFNHRAESPSFIIATSGIYIWLLSFRPRPVEIALLCLVFIFTSLSASNIFPGHIREDFLEPYVIKAVPCILVWGKIVVDLYRERGVTRNRAPISTLGQS